MKAQIVSFHCVLKDKLGRIISSSFNNDVINQPGPNANLLRGLVEGIQDVAKGEKREIYVSADQAYGYYDPELVVEVPRHELEKGSSLDIGQEVQTQSIEDGHHRTFRVIDAADDYVILDGNHPLAGQDLIFEIEITSAREAIPEDFEDTPEAEAKPKKMLH